MAADNSSSSEPSRAGASRAAATSDPGMSLDEKTLADIDSAKSSVSSLAAVLRPREKNPCSTFDTRGSTLAPPTRVHLVEERTKREHISGRGGSSAAANAMEFRKKRSGLGGEDSKRPGPKTIGDRIILGLRDCGGALCYPVKTCCPDQAELSGHEATGFGPKHSLEQCGQNRPAGALRQQDAAVDYISGEKPELQEEDLGPCKGSEIKEPGSSRRQGRELLKCDRGAYGISAPVGTFVQRTGGMPRALHPSRAESIPLYNESARSQDALRSSAHDVYHASSATLHTVSVTSLLSLEHGACDGRVVEWADVLEAEGIDVRDGRAEKGGVIRGSTAAGEIGRQQVLIGVLTFESPREGTLALSSLFLRDETATVRLVCVPPPPPSWVDKIVCVSRWTLTAATTKRSPGVRSTEKSPSRSRTPFNCCLEVGELTLWNPQQNRPQRPHTTDASVLRSESPWLRPGDRAVDAAKWVMTLADALAGGAVGLKTFVGRRGRGPVDIVARVAAVSPVIRFRNASPFFMVEVEEAEDDMATTHRFSEGSGNCPEKRLAEAEREDITKERSAASRTRLQRDSKHRPEERGKCHTVNSAQIFDALRENEARRANAEEEDVCVGTSAARHGTEGSVNTGNIVANLSSGVQQKEKERERAVRCRDEDKLNRGEGDCVNKVPNGDRFERSKRERGQGTPEWGGGRTAANDAGTGGAGEQLMTRLVLNGNRCLPWHTCIVPGKTYVFPAMGAIVLGGRGGQQKTYRAFGDALGGRPGRSPDGGGLVQLDTAHAIVASASRAQGVPQNDRQRQLSTAIHGLRNEITSDAATAESGMGEPKARSVEPPQSAVGNSPQEMDEEMRPMKGGIEGEATNLGERADNFCDCVLTYKGEITGIPAQAGTYVLDGSGGRQGIKLYLQHYFCSSLGAGLRRGALVLIHNVHPVYLLGELDGLGACLRTTIQVLRFSAHGADACYRPLIGGPNPSPIVVHAWKQAFNACFLCKENPPASIVADLYRRDTVRQQVDVSEHATSMGSSFESRFRDTRQHGKSGHSFEQLMDTPTYVLERTPEDARRHVVNLAIKSYENIVGSAANRPDGLNGKTSSSSISSFVSGSMGGSARESGAGSKRKRKETLEWGSRISKWVFGEALNLPKRDVYAEFLNHPSGVCGVVDPIAHGRKAYDNASLEWPMDSCSRKSRVGGASKTLLQSVEQGDEPTIFDEDFQRADERWHGDLTPTVDEAPRCRLRYHQHQSQQSLQQQETVPAADRVLRAAYRSLSEILEVAAEHALDLTSAALFGNSRDGLMAKSARSCELPTMVGPHATLTVRTPFGERSGRQDGALGWIFIDDGHNGKRRTDPGRKGDWFEENDVEIKGAMESNGTAGVEEITGRTLRKKAELMRSSEGAISKQVVWLRDRTARALMVVIATEPTISGSDVTSHSAHLKSDALDRRGFVLFPSSWVGSSTVKQMSSFAACTDDDSRIAGLTAANSGNTAHEAISSDRRDFIPAGGRAQPTTGENTTAKRRERPWERLAKPQSVHQRKEDLGEGSETGRFPRPAPPSPKPVDGNAEARAEKSCSERAEAAMPGGRGGAEGGFISTAPSQDPTLALMHKFAVCTEVVVLGRTSTERTPHKSTNSESRSTPRRSSEPQTKPGLSRRTGFCSAAEIIRSNVANNDCLSSGLSESRVVEGGVRVLLRHYIVVDEGDLQVLHYRNGRESVRGESMRSDRSARNGPPEIKRPQRKPEFQLQPVHKYQPQRQEQNQKGQQECGRQQQALNREEDMPKPARALTVSEALVVRTVESHTSRKSAGARHATPGKAEGSGLKIDPSHELESIAVVGVLLEIGFRVQGDGVYQQTSNPKKKRAAASADTAAGRSNRMRRGDVRGSVEVKASHRPKTDAATPIKDAIRAGRVSFMKEMRANKSTHFEDMFDCASGHGLQLCITLTQGLDRVCFYAGVCAESWPPGMIPGFSVIQVSGVCRRLSGNGKNIFLAKARTDDTAVQVLSLGLPPPPSHVPILGWSSPKKRLQSLRHSESAATAPVLVIPRAGQDVREGITAGMSPPLHVDRETLSARSSPVCMAGEGSEYLTADDLSANWGQMDSSSVLRERDVPFGHRGDRCELDTWTPAPIQHGRGVLVAERDGDSVFLDTHPQATDCPLDSGRSCGIGLGLGYSASSMTSLSHTKQPSFAAGNCTDLTAATNNTAGADPLGGETAAPSACTRLSGKSASRVSPALATLGSMLKKGVLSRATQRVTNLTVIGICFIKAAAWCSNCGLLKERDLASGTCWARCDASSSWQVRWEGSAYVDDGTAQAQFLMDGEDVVLLLELSSSDRQGIEAAARQHGPVVYFENMARRAGADSSPLPTLLLSDAMGALAAAVKRASRAIVTANCVQVAKRGVCARGTSNSYGGSAAKARGCGFGSAIIDVMGDRMETFTLPKLVLQAKGVENLAPRGEAYACLARLELLT